MRARAFGLHMLAYDPFIEELVDEPIRRRAGASLTELLQRSDIVSMHAPATPDAHHMLTEDHFRQMKPTALFISTGRGPTTDEEALIKALQEGWIAGAGLDVLEQEPPGDQSAPEDGQRHPDAACGLCLRPLRSGTEATGRARDRPGAERPLAEELCQPVGPGRAGLKRWQPFSMERGPGA